MIRLNARFEARDIEAADKIFDLARPLVECSRKDSGCIDYMLVADMYNPLAMAFIETWADDASLKAHSETEHFKTIVPQIHTLTNDGTKVDRFEF